MKKIAIILMCMLLCFALFTGCSNKKSNNDQDTNLSGSVEIDDTDLEIDAERKPDAENDSDYATLPDGYTYSFRDPENSDGIVVTPRE